MMMIDRDLNSYSCEDLSLQDLESINGGFGAYIVASLAATYYLGYAVGYLSR